VNKSSTYFGLNADEISKIAYLHPYGANAIRRLSQSKDDTELEKLYAILHTRNLEFSCDASLGDTHFDMSSTASDLDLVRGDEDLPLSIVVTSRNDTHVERMEDRTQAFIDCVYMLAEKHKRRVELIIVEWNPPADRRLMASEFSFKRESQYVSAVIYTVSKAIHSRYAWADSLPLYQMIAKNVGIRRARGKFILATNIDILLSSDLFLKITSGKLEERVLYRSNRWDVGREILDVEDVDARLEVATDLTFQINYREGIYKVGEKPPVRVEAEHGPNFDGASTALYHLHTEACGDFQLMHRNDWLRVRGYTELDAYSFHMDSVFALTCYYDGIQECLLDSPHYHIDHTLGVKVRGDTYEINERRAIKHLSMMDLVVLDHFQESHSKALVLNDESWGLATDNLNRNVMTSASWDHDAPVEMPCKHLIAHGLKRNASLYALEQVQQFQKDVFAEWSRNLWWGLKTFLDRRAAGKNLYVYGAGGRGSVVAKALTQVGLTVSGYVVTSDAEAASGKANDLPILSAQTFLGGTVEDKFFVIASIFADDIHAYLQSCGLVEGKHYIVGI